MTETATPQTTETTGQQVETQTERLAIVLDLICAGVNLEPRKIAEILTLQASALLADEGDRENSEALAMIANKLNPASYQEF
jgi:hypothetical protein